MKYERYQINVFLGLKAYLPRYKGFNIFIFPSPSFQFESIFTVFLNDFTFVTKISMFGSNMSDPNMIKVLFPLSGIFQNYSSLR